MNEMPCASVPDRRLPRTLDQGLATNMPIPEVMFLIDALSDEADRLMNKVANLGTRLQPVSQPMPPPKPQGELPASTPVSGALASILTRLKTVTDAVDGMYETLQI